MRAVLVGLLFAVSTPLAGAPGLRHQLYGASVLVVAPIGRGRHVGFIVNRPTDTTLGSLFPEHAPSQKVVDPVHLGGPLQPGLIFALVQRPTTPGGNSFEMMPGLYAAFQAEVIDRIIESEPQRAKFVAGLVAWQPGELRDEVELGAWHVVDAEPSVVMRASEGLWEELIQRTERRRNSI